MCLFLSDEKIEDQRKRIFKNKKKIRVYKIFDFTSDSQILTSVMGSPVTLRNGFFVSNRKSANLTRVEKRNLEVEKGIHVYLKKPYALDEVYVGETVIPCEVSVEDFVAAEVGETSHTEAVFTKVKPLFSKKLIKKFNL